MSISSAFALASSLSACDMPNNEVKLNPENQSAEFKVEYQYYRWASDIEIVDYYVTVQKKWDTYVGEINEKNGWGGEKITVEVAAGDTVWDIAEQFKSDGKDVRKAVYEICQANDLHDGEIHSGMILTIPENL